MSFPFGVSTAATIRVGNLVGANRPSEAKLAGMSVCTNECLTDMCRLAMRLALLWLQMPVEFLWLQMHQGLVQLQIPLRLFQLTFRWL